jgi:hypothetical protein
MDEIICEIKINSKSEYNNQNGNDVCPICLDAVPVINATTCSHLLCKECATQLYKITRSTSVCPICREGIDIEKGVIFPDLLKLINEPEVPSESWVNRHRGFILSAWFIFCITGLFLVDSTYE